MSCTPQFVCLPDQHEPSLAMSELGINGAHSHLQAMQVRQIRTAPRAPIQPQTQATPRPAAELGKKVAWGQTIAHAASARPTDGQVTGAFNKMSASLSRELQSTGSNNAAAFGHIGALQTAYQYALSASQSLQSSATLRPLD